MRRRLLALLASLVALAAGAFSALVAAQPAAAGNGYPACGSACDGKDPQNWKWYPFGNKTYIYCSTGAYTVGWASTSTIDVELRYSPTCETTWGRYTVTVWQGMPFQLKHYSYYPNGTLRATAHGQVQGAGPWGKMLDDHNMYNYVCIEQWWWDHLYDPPDEVACTGSY
jgi:hypothetical protein